ncbi:MAG: hypothetical protein Q7V63_03005 [Gammaproteobacteria bacterium]|nr:hypothetical protein [Gammaproteobacteria bacterium]
MAMGLDEIRSYLVKFEAQINNLHTLQLDLHKARVDTYLATVRLLSAQTTRIITAASAPISDLQEALSECCNSLGRSLAQLDHLQYQITQTKKILSSKLKRTLPSISEGEKAELEATIKHKDSSVSVLSPVEECDQISELLSAIHHNQQHFIKSAKLFAATDFISPELAKQANCTTYFDILNIVYPIKIISDAEHGVGGMRHDLQPIITEMLRAKLAEIKVAEAELPAPFDNAAYRYLAEELDTVFNFMFSARGNKVQLAGKAQSIDAEDAVEVYKPAANELARKFLKTSLSNYFLARRAEGYSNQILEKGCQLSDKELEINSQINRYYQAQFHTMEPHDRFDEDLATAAITTQHLLILEITKLETEKTKLLQEYEALIDTMENHKIPAINQRVEHLKTIGLRSHRSKFATEVKDVETSACATPLMNLGRTRVSRFADSPTEGPST